MFVLVSDNKVQQYPYSLVELHRDNPNVSFPNPISAEDLADWGVYQVEDSPPEFDEISQEALPLDPVWNEDKQAWVEAWQINDFSDDIVQQNCRNAADYRGFSTKLNESQAYSKIKTQATESLPLTVACTEFIAVLQDHKFGERNEFLFKQSFEAVLGLCSLEDADYQQLQCLMNLTGLGRIFTVWDGDLPADFVAQECGLISGGGN